MDKGFKLDTSSYSYDYEGMLVVPNGDNVAS